MKRKGPSLILVLSMLFALLLGTAINVNAKEVNSIDISLIEIPALDAAPDYLFGTPAGSGYFTQSIRWIKTYADATSYEKLQDAREYGYVMQDYDFFNAGNWYILEITMIQDENVTYADNVDVTFNGEKAHYVYDNGQAIVWNSYYVSGPNAINSVTATDIEAPAFGKRADTNVIIEENEIRDTSMLIWAELDEKPETVEDVDAVGSDLYHEHEELYFDAGKYYVAIVEACADNSYYYSADIESFNATVNGKAPTFLALHSSTYTYLYYVFDPVEPIPVEIDIEKTIEQGGELAPDEQTFNFELFDFAYDAYNEELDFEITGNTLTVDEVGTFETTLTLEITDVNQFLNLSEGFYLKETAGDADNWSYSDTTYFVSYNFEAEKWEIVDASLLENADADVNSVEKASFTNVYTKNPPQTGDATNTVVLVVLLAASVLGVGFVATKRYAE